MWYPIVFASRTVSVARSSASHPRSFGAVAAHSYHGLPKPSIAFCAGTVLSPLNSPGSRSVPPSTAIVGRGISRCVAADASNTVVTVE
jgi:hypothetical protein